MTHIWTRVAKEHEKELKVLGKEVPVPKTPFLRITFETPCGACRPLASTCPNGKASMRRRTTCGASTSATLKRNNSATFYARRATISFSSPSSPSWRSPSTACRSMVHAGRVEPFLRPRIPRRGIALSAQRIHDPKLLEEGLRRKDWTRRISRATSKRSGTACHRTVAAASGWNGSSCRCWN